MDAIKQTIQAARAERQNHMLKSFANLKEVDEEEMLRKAEEAEEVEEKEADAEEEAEEKTKEKADADDETTLVGYVKAANKEANENMKENLRMEKSDIFDAISEGGKTNFPVVKTGKEIKEQIDSLIMPSLTAELEAKKREADAELEKCGNAPTSCVDPWELRGLKIDIGYKTYKWNETYIPCNCEQRLASTLSAEDEAEKRGNCPKDAAEAEARQKYNEIVRFICKIIIDLKACEILKNLDDKKKFELTPRQMLVFKFS